MKKIIITLLLVAMVITPCYALNIIDALLCKKVFLRATGRTILVNRITSEAKYILKKNGEWMLLTGSLKSQCQAIYNVQSKAKK